MDYLETLSPKYDEENMEAALILFAKGIVHRPHPCPACNAPLSRGPHFDYCRNVDCMLRGLRI